MEWNIHQNIVIRGIRHLIRESPLSARQSNCKYQQLLFDKLVFQAIM